MYKSKISPEHQCHFGKRGRRLVAPVFLMTQLSIRRVSVSLVIVALLVLSTAAVAHGHLDAASADESHCPLCIAVHSAKHAVTPPAVGLSFAQVETAVFAPPAILSLVFAALLLRQGRAPPVF
jgi:hypothetical protein